MPPRRSPSAPPPPAMAPKMPKALPRSAGSVNVVVSSDSAAGASSAPKTPWPARATTSMSKLTAAPPIADITANPTRPTMKVVLRPSRSDSRPPRSSRLPNASEYAVTIHCRSASPNPSDSCACGSAMFTMVASSTTINCARPSTPSTTHRRRWCRSSRDSPFADNPSAVS